MNTKTCLALLLAALIVALPGFLAAQSIFATLTGVVSDPAQAVVPNASVTLKNRASGDVRVTQTNAEGYYTFASVPVGTYDLTVTAPGFLEHRTEGIAFTGADKRNINVGLKIGQAAATVDVTSVADLVTPVDSGEKSATLQTKQLQDFSVVGRSAAEFIKIMPGFGIAGTGTSNKTNFSGEVIGINGNGDAGSQSALNNAYNVNGMPGSTLDITADGAHVSDPGCNCATPVNPNTDMIQEFKVLTSNFGADNQKGPAVISSVSKSGGRDFHGEAYMYARHYAMNANDWLNNRQGIDKNSGKMAAPRPENKFLFPGGQIGGPVLIPGTNFNKNRDKLFFFAAYEFYYQTLDTGLIRATVPTTGMQGGNFSPTELAKLGNITSSGSAPQQITDAAFPGGIIPASQIDKGGLAMMKLLPAANADPNANGGYNYVQQIVFNQNSNQFMTREDWSISDSTKLFVRYNRQWEQQKFPIGLWWRNGNQVPYPTPVIGKNSSDSVSASLTHVFSPSMTNEVVVAYTQINFPNVFEDPAKVQRATVGYPYKGLYKNGITQIPSFTGWGGELATLLNPGGFEVGGSRGLYADKYMPTVSESLTKVWGTHTSKFGAFYEWIRNAQPANGNTNGQIVFANWGSNSTGSVYGDLLTGRVNSYNEQSFNRLNDIAYNTYEFYATDSWKVTKRLSVDYGMRFSHFGQWADRLGFGYSIFDYSKYNSKAPATDYSGFLWNARDKSVPLSGFPTRAMFFAPRFGAAFDIFGNGQTVVRGGWGRFYYHSPQFTSGLDVSAGVKASTISTPTTLAAIDASTPGLGDALGAQAVDPKDNRSPYSDSYSVTVSQRTPFSGMFEVAYVGNRSKQGLQTGGQGSAINLVPYGALLKASVGNPSDANLDSYRPLAGFGDINIITHGMYQNYNSMQMTWVRTKGRYNLNLNYTFGKSLGILNTGWDAFNLRNNYGLMPNDRRHLFNAAYSVEMGEIARTSNKVARGVLNGWQLSGIAQVQSGQNVLANTSYNFNMDTGGYKLANGYTVSDRAINGTNALALRPLVTCSPTSNLKTNQYVNGACYAMPTVPGQNGPTISPGVYGPTYMNFDLGLFKNFQISESKKIQIRFMGYNFLNHPLWSFVDGSNNLKLVYDQNTGKLANPNFGITTEKQGHRTLSVAVKYYF